MNEIHVDARNNFNNKIKGLLDIFLEKKIYINDKATFEIESHGVATLTENDILEIPVSKETNYRDQEISRFISIGENAFGFFNEHYQYFSELANKIHKLPNFQKSVHISSIKEIIFDWVRLSYQKKIEIEPIDFLLEKVKIKRKKWDVWIPIDSTYIESPLEICNVTILPLSSQIIENWISNTKPKNDKSSQDIELFFDQLKTEFLGKAIAHCQIEADAESANEIGLLHADIATRVLNFFNPNSLLGDSGSNSAPAGYYSVSTSNAIFVSEDTFKMHKGSMRRYEDFYINNEKIIRIREAFLDNFNNIYLEKQRKMNNFQKNIIETFLRYMLYAFSPSTEQKLIYILSALESLLLKNKSEPIQTNVSDRLAFFISSEPAERLKIIKDFKDTYELRSSFVHHGIQITELETVERFLLYTKVFFEKAIAYSHEFENLQIFLEHLDLIKYS